MFRTFLSILACLWCLGSAMGVAHAQAPGLGAVELELIADTAAIVPGKPFTAVLHLKIAPGWHTYWVNPGDSGLPVELEWKLPAGWKTGALQWPLPEKQVEPGDIVTYGYEKEVLLFVQVTPPATLSPGDVTLQAHASWLVCEKSCVPGGTDLSLVLPVVSGMGEAPQAANSELFAKFRSQLPLPGAPPFAIRWESHDTETHLRVGSLPAGERVDFFPITRLPGHPETVSPTVIRIPLSVSSERPAVATITGLLVAEKDGHRRGWIVSNAVAAPTPGVASPPPRGGGSMLTLPAALLLGLIGGFILNLMPCVLPVIALKIFGFLGQAGESRQRVFRTGLAFVAGIFAWFLVLATLIVSARAAGHEITWAFQFQSPRFVLAMLAVVFVFSLNLLGVFELWLPGTNRLVTLSEKEGYGGAFFHGAFATLLATPCTAPFLAPALAFAFAQSAPVTFAMFVAIAAGMSAPYLLLSANPGWMRFLPKPGAWMVRLKQALGFLMLGSGVWLLGVLATQRGASGAIGALWLLLGIGIACWIFGTWLTPEAPPSGKFAAMAAMAAVITLGALLGRPPGATQEGTKVVWEPWSPERVAVLQEEGKPVFIDFTADWCLNCKYNERFVLESAPVRKALQGVATLRADWTKGDPTISAELKRLGRAGVPVYVVYPASKGQAELLPELLTRKVVLDALQRARRG